MLKAARHKGDSPMLAEKFFLFLESLIRREAYSDGNEKVVNLSPHVPVKRGDDLASAAILPSQPRHPPVG
jgi:hypothetical protein